MLSSCFLNLEPVENNAFLGCTLECTLKQATSSQVCWGKGLLHETVTHVVSFLILSRIQLTRRSHPCGPWIEDSWKLSVFCHTRYSR